MGRLDNHVVAKTASVRSVFSNLCFPIYVFQSKCVSIIDDIRSVEMMS